MDAETAELPELLELGEDPVDEVALAEVVRDLRAVLLVPPPADVAAAHLAAMRQATVRVVDGPASSGRPARSAATAARGTNTTEATGTVGVSWGRRATVAGGIAAAVLIGTAGLAAAGSLPDPVQRRVSEVVGHLGIELPQPEADPGSNPPATADVGGPAAPTPAAPTTHESTALDDSTKDPAVEDPTKDPSTDPSKDPTDPNGPPTSVPGAGQPGGPEDKTSPTVRGPADPDPGAPGPADPGRGNPGQNPVGKPLPGNDNPGNGNPNPGNGNPNPGNGNPNPGNGNPGNGNPNPGKPTTTTTAPTTTVAPTTTAAPTTPEDTGNKGKGKS